MTELLRRAFSAAIFGGACLLSAACGGSGSDAAEPSAEANAAPAKVANDGIERAKSGALSDMALGEEDAPLTVIEYASVTCPACATFHDRVLPEIKEKFIDTGKVRFVFREFPTAPAELSVVGSMLARCASDKGGADAYFLVLDTLFKTQRKWIYEEPRAELLKIAAQAGIDEDGFKACVEREELLDYINQNIDEGSKKYGVKSTPSFIIDGKIRHFSNAEDMAAALDAAIEKVSK